MSGEVIVAGLKVLFRERPRFLLRVERIKPTVHVESMGVLVWSAILVKVVLAVGSMLDGERVNAMLVSHVVPSDTACVRFPAP